MEDGKGDKFPSIHTSNHKDTHNLRDSPIRWSQRWVSLRFWGLLAVSVSGRGFHIEGAFLMGRSTQPTDCRLYKNACIPKHFSQLLSPSVWICQSRPSGQAGETRLILGIRKIVRLQCWVSLRFWGLLAVSVSGRGYHIEGSFLMVRSTQPTDCRLYKNACIPKHFSQLLSPSVWICQSRPSGQAGETRLILGIRKIVRFQCWVSLRFWGLLAVSVSGRGYHIEGAFLMVRSTQPTDCRLYKNACIPKHFSQLLSASVWICQSRPSGQAGETRLILGIRKIVRLQCWVSLRFWGLLAVSVSGRG